MAVRDVDPVATGVTDLEVAAALGVMVGLAKGLSSEGAACLLLLAAADLLSRLVADLAPML